MEFYRQDEEIKKQEQTEEDLAQKEQEACEEALKQFKISPYYPYLIKSIEVKIQSVTDTRILAKNFGKIKGEVIGELGTLGVASLMASAPLEELLEELE